MSANGGERQASSARAWGDLWRRGVLHSCAAGIDGNYDGAIAAFWSNCYQALNAGDRVVDLATGNGALALLAKQDALRREMPLEIHGVDLAPIRPTEHLDGGADLMAGIHFHSGIDMAQLPFADASVSLVCSQFGFEYAASPAVVAEIVRVLTDDGRACLVMHSHDSLVARTAPAQRAGIDYLLTAPLSEHLTAIAHLIADAPGGAARRALADSAAAEHARTTFNASVEALLARVDELPDAHVLQQATLQVRHVLEAASRGDRSAMTQQLADWRASLEAERIRLLDLDAALVDSVRLAQIEAWFSDAGLHVETGRMMQATDSPMGWTLVARRG